MYHMFHRVSQLYDTANLLYSQTIYRASPYITGIVVGYLLRRSEDGIRERLQRPLAAIGWIISVSLGMLSILTPVHLARRGYEYDVVEAAQYAALSPISWSLALGWFIIACYMGYGGKNKTTVLIFIVIIIISSLIKQRC